MIPNTNEKIWDPSWKGLNTPAKTVATHYNDVEGWALAMDLSDLPRGWD